MNIRPNLSWEEIRDARGSETTHETLMHPPLSLRRCALSETPVACGDRVLLAVVSRADDLFENGSHGPEHIASYWRFHAPLVAGRVEEAGFLPEGDTSLYVDEIDAASLAAGRRVVRSTRLLDTVVFRSDVVDAAITVSERHAATRALITCLTGSGTTYLEAERYFVPDAGLSGPLAILRAALDRHLSYRPHPAYAGDAEEVAAALARESALVAAVVETALVGQAMAMLGRYLLPNRLRGGTFSRVLSTRMATCVAPAI